jgi:beta-galactosidase
MVYIAHYWKRRLVPNDVWVASNCERVELFVNGKSCGRKMPDQYPHLPHPLAVWKGVVFKPGEIRAVGYIRDTVAAAHVRTTPGPPVALTVIPDDTVLFDGGDMTRVVVVAVDSHGRTVPAADDTVALSVSGVGDFIGESPVALEDGKTAFFIKTRADETGTVTCRAACRGFKSASARLTVLNDPQAPLRRRVLGR